MSYQFNQIIYSNNKILKKEPQKITPSASVAIFAHIFYIDLWKEINGYLQALSLPYDLYITVPPHIEESALMELFQSNANIKVYMCENRGRDVLPFLQILSLVGIDSYSYICKLHTKKTGDSPLGHVWRKLLYFDLLSSQELVDNIIEMFKTDATIAQVTAKNTILDSKRYAYGNNGKIKWLCEQCGIEFKEEYTFAGGTMFWSRADILKPLLDLFESGKLHFEEERGQKDHTIAHAIERFFGIIIQSKNMQIAKSPSEYTHLPNDLIEETASLVLSQQYAGESIFEKVNELNSTAQELREEMAELHEALRLKNRLISTPVDLFKKTLSLLHSSASSLSALDSSKLKDSCKKTTTSVITVTKNPQAFKKVFYYLKRGEVRYLASKIKEKLKKNLNSSNSFVKVTPSNYFATFDKDEYTIGNHTVDIIIPLYNGYKFLTPLFQSIKKNTTHPYRLIVVDDASPDEKVKPLLKKLLKEHPHTLLIENSKNLGFVKSVNRALKEVKGHFVLLNTDTEVPPLWLERLMYPIFHMPNVASTTPLTNSGTVASFPRFLEDNEIFEYLRVDELDRCFQSVRAKELYSSMPTGIGFCMGVNYQLTQEIGFFDEERFGLGYGEENDWCQRAIKHGYSNLLVPNLFVYHKHGGSFPSDVKRQLMQRNHLKLLENYPDYDRQVENYVQKNPYKTLRKLLIITASSIQNPLWVMFDHALGGGANHYAKELLAQKVADNFNTLYVAYDFYTNEYKCSYHYGEYQFQFSIASIDELDVLLKQCTVGEVFINSLVSFPQQKELLEFIDNLTPKETTKLTLPIHEYFCICPSFNLLGQNGSYCGIPDLQTCQSCMQNSKQEWKNLFLEEIDILSWRELWLKLLEKSDKIVCFSNSSKKILQKAYPQLKENIVIKPHTVKNLPPITLAAKNKEEPLVVGILGGINYAKGASIVRDLVALIDKKNYNINVVVIGEITEPIQSNRFTVTGRYEKSALPKLIEKYKIDIFTIPSVCPETFSYTTQEIISMQLPIVVFNLGAPAQRVKNYDKGHVVDKISAEALLEKFESTFL